MFGENEKAATTVKNVAKLSSAFARNKWRNARSRARTHRFQGVYFFKCRLYLRQLKRVFIFLICSGAQSGKKNTDSFSIKWWWRFQMEVYFVCHPHWLDCHFFHLLLLVIFKWAIKVHQNPINNQNYITGGLIPTGATATLTRGCWHANLALFTASVLFGLFRVHICRVNNYRFFFFRFLFVDLFNMYMYFIFIFIFFAEMLSAAT